VSSYSSFYFHFQLFCTVSKVTRKFYHAPGMTPHAKNVVVRASLEILRSFSNNICSSLPKRTASISWESRTNMSLAAPTLPFRILLPVRGLIGSHACPWRGISTKAQVKRPLISKPGRAQSRHGSRIRVSFAIIYQYSFPSNTYPSSISMRPNVRALLQTLMPRLG